MGSRGSSTSTRSAMPSPPRELDTTAVGPHESVRGNDSNLNAEGAYVIGIETVEDAAAFVYAGSYDPRRVSGGLAGGFVLQPSTRTDYMYSSSPIHGHKKITAFEPTVKGRPLSKTGIAKFGESALSYSVSQNPTTGQWHIGYPEISWDTHRLSPGFASRDAALLSARREIEASTGMKLDIMVDAKTRATTIAKSKMFSTS